MTSQGQAPNGEDELRVSLDQLPVATIAAKDSVFVAMNRAYQDLTGWGPEQMLGKTLPELLTQLVAPRDRAVLAELAKNRSSKNPKPHGWLWCRITTPSGEERPVRVEWRLDETGRDSLVFLFDAKPEVVGLEVTEALARVGGVLSRCSTEEEVLVRAVDALAERGFLASVLLIDEQDDLLRHGPTARPQRRGDFAPTDLPRPHKDVLTRINPGFSERHTAFFQDGMRIVREAYAEPVAERVRALLPAQLMVQAPLFLADAPYGALIVTGEALSPLVATALDLFAEMVGKALETVRLRAERTERDRLAALGEAAAVMAHEVRNPVGSIMNALALLNRDGSASPNDKALLAIISEETSRLEHLVTQLLDLGRPLLPNPCAYSMEELTRRAVRLLTTRGELDEQSVAMPHSEGTMAWLDPDLAELALVNVLRNAAQSTTRGRPIVVTVARGEGTVCVRVEDEGPGIPAERVKQLGQPFMTTRATGTGMGLAVVKRILEASHGTLAFDRGASGGALVTLEFPATP